MKIINWGIIGCGDVTEVKSGPGFQKASNSSLVAVMRRNAELARDYARRHNVPKWYDRADQLISDPAVNAVYIATPPSTHKEYTIMVAKAGKPVYVEKPMALHYDESLIMIEVCRQAKVPLFVAYYRRALPRFLKIKSLIENNSIGEVRFVNITFHQPPAEKDLYGEKHWRVDPEIAGCGYFCDLGSHMLDIVQFFLGDISSAQGATSNQLGLYKAEDTVSAQFEFESNIHGTGIWNFASFKKLDRTEIVGEKGKITFSTFDENPILLETKTSSRKFNLKNPRHIQQPLIQTIIDDLNGVSKCPSYGHTAAQTSKIIDLILGRIS